MKSRRRELKRIVKQSASQVARKKKAKRGKQSARLLRSSSKPDLSGGVLRKLAGAHVDYNDHDDDDGGDDNDDLNAAGDDDDDDDDDYWEV